MKVLIVDDNEELTGAVKDLLDGIGIECKVKNEGEEGLNEILTKKGTYDLILLDMAMPQFSGYDVLERLKGEDLLKTENIVTAGLYKKQIDINDLSKGIYFLKITTAKGVSVGKIVKN